MQKSTKIKIIVTVVLSIFALAFFISGMIRPSPADVEKAVLRDIQSYDDYQWVQEVEVIKYIDLFMDYGLVEMPGEVGTPLWSVKVCLIGDQQREERIVYLCGMFGRWWVERWPIPIPP